jgi:hypothetical protein
MPSRIEDGGTLKVKSNHCYNMNNFNVNLFTYIYTYINLIDCNLLSHSTQVPPS